MPERALVAAAEPPAGIFGQGESGRGARFVWHARARLVDAAGQVFGPGVLAAAVGDDQPAAVAVQRALAAAAQGRAFRIGAEAAGVPAAAAQPMFETLTAGTSGAPRRIWRSQASWTASFAVDAGLFGIGPGVRVAVLGQLQHSLALYGALEGVHLGADVHLLAGLRPDRQRSALAARQVAVIWATPAQLRLLLVAGGAAVPQVRFVLVGGAHLDAATRAGLALAFPGADIRCFYGAAEASFITLTDAATPEGAVGRPYPGVAVEVRDPVDGLGEIWVKSPYLAAGYVEPGGQAAVWRDGWLSVGELGRLEDGQLFLAGRRSRMVTVADQNVFPEAIEGFLLGLPGVVQAAVLARPDTRRGHRLLAVVQGDAAAESAILRALRQQFGALKAPRRVIWRQDWPLLASGKTDLAALERALA